MGVEELRDNVDTLITIPNEKLLAVAGKDTPMLDTFKMADEVLLQAVKGISDLIIIPGLINLDFADVRTIMGEMGMALMGTGVGEGENRAMEAAQKAISSPLLENVSINGATGIIINISGPTDMTLFEVNEASKMVQQEAHEDANIIFGAVIDEKLKDKLRVTVIATGFNKKPKKTVSAPATMLPKYKTPYPSAVPPGKVIRNASANAGASWGQGAGRDESSASAATSEQRPSPPPANRTARQMEMMETQVQAPVSDLKKLVAEIGVIDMGQDEYDIPTFLRKQAD